MSGPLEAIFCHEGLGPLVASARKRVAGAINDLLATGGLLCADFGDHASDSEATDEASADANNDLAPVTGKILIRRGHC
jgi:hypothetical protein